MEQIQPNGTFTHCFTTISILHQKNCLISILKFFIKNDLSTQTLGPPEKHIKIFKNQKSNVTTQTQTPIQKTTFHQYTSFTKFLYFLRYGPISTCIPHIFHIFKFECFDLKNPKIQSSLNPSWHTVPNPNWSKKVQKIQHWSSFWLWNRYTHTFGRRCL